MYKILSVSLFTCLAFMGTQDAFAGKQTPQDPQAKKAHIKIQLKDLNKPVQTTSMKPRISFKKIKPSMKPQVSVETGTVSTFNGLKWEIKYSNSESANLDIACEKMRNMDIRD